MLSIEKFPFYAYDEQAYPEPYGYVQASSDMTSDLEEILKKAKNFNELQQELTNFVSERTDFNNFAEGFLRAEGHLKDPRLKL